MKEHIIHRTLQYLKPFDIGLYHRQDLQCVHRRVQLYLIPLVILLIGNLQMLQQLCQMFLLCCGKDEFVFCVAIL